MLLSSEPIRVGSLSDHGAITISRRDDRSQRYEIACVADCDVTLKSKHRGQIRNCRRRCKQAQSTVCLLQAPKQPKNEHTLKRKGSKVSQLGSPFARKVSCHGLIVSADHRFSQGETMNPIGRPAQYHVFKFLRAMHLYYWRRQTATHLSSSVLPLYARAQRSAERTILLRDEIARSSLRQRASLLPMRTLPKRCGRKHGNPKSGNAIGISRRAGSKFKAPRRPYQFERV